MPISKSHKPYLLHLKRRRGLAAINFHELWEYRDLLWLLTTRDIKVRYKQAAIGILWAILQPLITMLTFSIFFGYLGGMGDKIEGGIPYPIFTFCALLPWQLFAQAVTTSSTSIVDSQNLISKVYFPRILVPSACVVASMIDFAFGFAVLLGMMAYYGIMPGPEVLLLPVLVVFAAITALSIGIWLSALTAMYRDFRYMTGFMVQVWLFVTPVAYPASIVPEKWQLLYAMNPMTGVVEGFRWILLGHSTPPIAPMMMSLCVVTVLLVTGTIYFRWMERTMADWV